MAIISTTVNRRCAVSDLFDSFHGAHEACSKLKEKNYPEESIFEFVQLTGNDDLDARSLILKDLGFTPQRIERLDEFLGEGKILICVDVADESESLKAQKILSEAGALGLENFIVRARTPANKAPAKRAKTSRPKRLKQEN